MDLFGKLRAFAFDTKGAKGGLPFLGDNARNCFLCECDLGSVDWVQCSICGYVFCRRCCSPGAKESASTCDFCNHLRLGSLTQQSLDATTGDLVNAGQKGASPYALSRLSSQASTPAYWQHSSSASNRLSRSSSSVHRQVVGDLTWEVPPELEHDYGLSAEDKHQRQLLRTSQQQQQQQQQQQRQGAAQPALQGSHSQLPPLNNQHPPTLSTASPTTPSNHTTPTSTPEQPKPPPGWGVLNSLGADGSPPHPPTSLVGLHRQLLGATATHHLQRLVGQLLVSEGVPDPAAWQGVLTRLACDAAALVQPPKMVSNGVLDPRHYIKVKKLADIGRPCDSCVLPAVVCKRNVAHRRMRTHLQWPKVVLLGGPLEHQRSEERLSSIETLIEQEPDQLRSAVRYIASLGTELLIVEKSVARAAQEELLARGMTLVLNVKAELMERLARCMGTTVAPSVEELSAKHVGTCREFRVDPLSAHAVPAGSTLPPMRAASPTAAPATSNPAAAAQRTASPVAPTASSGVAATTLRTGSPSSVPAAIHGGGLASTLRAASPAAAAAPGAASTPTTVAPRTSLGSTPLAASTLPTAAAAAAVPTAAPTTAGLQAAALPTAAPGVVPAAATVPAAAAPTTAPVAVPATSSVRTLMCFGCAVPLGATLLLKGGDMATLARVKRVARFAVLAAYAARLESAFLAEELVAGLVSAGPEGPLSSAAASGGGLGSLRPASSAIISSSARNAANCMPNGVMLALTPHLSIWDQSLAAESDEAVWTAAAVAAAAAPQALQPGSKLPQLQQQNGKADAVLPAASLPSGVAKNGDGSVGVGPAGLQAGQVPGPTAGAAPSVPAAQKANAVTTQKANAVASAPAGTTPTSAAAATGAVAGGQMGKQADAGPDVWAAAAAAVVASNVLPQGASPPLPLPGAAAAMAAQPTAAAPTQQPLGNGMVAEKAAATPAQAESNAQVQAQVAAILKLKALQGLQVYDYQRIQISMSCRNPKKQLLCEPHCIKRIDYYAPTDMSLLQFILAASPSPYKRCTMTNCADGVTAHVRSFLHGCARITISIATVAASEALPNEDKQQVWMWLRPKGRGTSARPDVRRLPLSAEAACLSLGHFLQLTFTADMLDVGGRCLHHDYVRYFGMGRSIICMYQDRIAPFTVIMPKLACVYGLPAQLKWLRQEAIDLEEEAREAFAAIEGALHHQPRLLQQHAPLTAPEGTPAGTTTPVAAAANGSFADGEKLPLRREATGLDQQQQLQSTQGSIGAVHAAMGDAGAFSAPASPQRAQTQLKREGQVQMVQQQAGLRALRGMIRQDRAAFLSKVAACLQRPFSHPAVQEVAQGPLAPPPINVDADTSSTSRFSHAPSHSHQTDTVFRMSTLNDTEDGSTQGAQGVRANGNAGHAGNGGDVKGSAGGAKAGGAPEGEGAQDTGAAQNTGGACTDAAAGAVQTQPAAASHVSTSQAAEGSVNSSTPKQEPQGERQEAAGARGIALHLGSPVLSHSSNVLGGGSGRLEGVRVGEGQGQDTGSGGQQAEGAKNDEGSGSPARPAACVSGFAEASKTAQVEEGRGEEAGRELQLVQSQPQSQLQLQQQEEGVGWSTDGRVERFDPWEAEVAAGLHQLHQLRRSLAVTLLSWAANLQDPDGFASQCMQAHSLQHQRHQQHQQLLQQHQQYQQQQQQQQQQGQQPWGAADVFAQSPASPLPGAGSGGSGVGGGQGMEGTLALMQQLESEAASAGLLPMPIIASSIGPISIPDVASLAVGAARSHSSPTSLTSALAPRGPVHTLEGCTSPPMEAASCEGGKQQQQQQVPESHGQQQQQQQQQQQGEQVLGPQQQQQMPDSHGRHQHQHQHQLQNQHQHHCQQQQEGAQGAQHVDVAHRREHEQGHEHEQEHDHEEDDSYKCYGGLHAPLADASMEGDNDDDTAFYPQELPSFADDTSEAPPSPSFSSTTTTTAATNNTTAAPTTTATTTSTTQPPHPSTHPKPTADAPHSTGNDKDTATAATAAGPVPPAARTAAKSAVEELRSSSGVGGAGMTHSASMPQVGSHSGVLQGGGSSEEGLGAAGAGSALRKEDKAQGLSVAAKPPQAMAADKASAAASPLTPRTSNQMSKGPGSQGGNTPWLMSKPQADSKVPLVNLGGNAPIIGRLCMPGRTLLPSGIEDMVVPIHDCEPSSIIAHCLASRPYHLLLNAAIKGMFVDLRRGRPTPTSEVYYPHNTAAGPSPSPSSRADTASAASVPASGAGSVSGSVSGGAVGEAAGAGSTGIPTTENAPGAGATTAPRTQAPSPTPAPAVPTPARSSAEFSGTGAAAAQPVSKASPTTAAPQPQHPYQHPHQHPPTPPSPLKPSPHPASPAPPPTPTPHPPCSTQATTTAPPASPSKAPTPPPHAPTHARSHSSSSSGTCRPHTVSAPATSTLPTAQPPTANPPHPTPNMHAHAPSHTRTHSSSSAAGPANPPAAAPGAVPSTRAPPQAAPHTSTQAHTSASTGAGDASTSATATQQQQQQQVRQQQGSSTGGAADSAAGGSSGAGAQRGAGGGLRLGDLDWLSIMLSHEPAHIRHAFEDEGLGMPWTRAKFQVVCFFAPQFAELRRRVVQGGEVAYLTSLSRCVRWAQRGGKSNAYFAKTRDDRYIIKSMSKAEKASFLEFAPAYFEHAAKSSLSGQRTCLAKVLGMYQITAKTLTGASGLAATNAGKDGVLDLLVMENCFYDQHISRIYDLKGSERNRFNVDAAANPHDAKEVHLDDNLRRANLSAPLMVTPASQRQLELALWADTAFLSSLAIMDYSLLVGVDKDDHVLAVAIIDFIRQYTWDKQLETWVKGSGILGGGGKEPTIISPKQYMRRFRTAIMSYFTVVPGSAEMNPPLDPES